MTRPRNTGRAWERECAIENQQAFDEGLAVITRMATHHHDGIPSGDPKVDFIGCLAGSGRLVAYDAKSGKGVLTRKQRTFLAHLTRAGALAFVYHSDGYVRLMLPKGDLGPKIKVSKWIEIT